MGFDSVGEGTCRLLTHKGYAVEIVDSIIKETDVEPCANQETKEVKALGLFDLSRACFNFPPTALLYSLANSYNSFLGPGSHESPIR